MSLVPVVSLPSEKAPAPPSPNCTLLVVSRIPFFQKLCTSSVRVSTSLPRSIKIGFAPLCASISAANNPAGPAPTTTGLTVPLNFSTLYSYFSAISAFLNFLHIFSSFTKSSASTVARKNILSFFLASIERLKIVQLLKNFLSTLISFAALFKTVSLV